MADPATLVDRRDVQALGHRRRTDGKGQHLRDWVRGRRPLQIGVGCGEIGPEPLEAVGVGQVDAARTHDRTGPRPALPGTGSVVGPAPPFLAARPRHDDNPQPRSGSSVVSSFSSGSHSAAGDAAHRSRGQLPTDVSARGLAARRCRSITTELQARHEWFLRRTVRGWTGLSSCPSTVPLGRDIPEQQDAQGATDAGRRAAGRAAGDAPGCLAG